MVTWNKWKNLVFEYCDANNHAPPQTYKCENINIGKWLQTQKEKITSDTDELYITLAKNKHVKQSIDTYLSNKKVNKNVTKFTQDEWKKLLFEYCDINKTVPPYGNSYKGRKIGNWLSDQKRKLDCTTDNIYITLSKNIHVKKSLDEYLKNKENNKDFVKFTQDELKHLLFEYCNANKSAPSSKCEYKNAQIGGWLQNQKKTIKCNKDRAYINLSSNAYVKESLDTYLQCKSKNVANKINKL